VVVHSPTTPLCSSFWWRRNTTWVKNPIFSTYIC
jgi:hypothetical protein